MATADPPETDVVFWPSRAIGEVLTLLGTSPTGLAAGEAARRLKIQGRNELREAPRVRSLEILAAQFRSLIVWILIGAAIVSGLLGQRVDCLAILAIVVLNAAIGFYQEFSAERSIAALRKLTAPHAKVWRDGRIVSLPSPEIVLGDVVELGPGDLVPADARILRAASLKVTESVLTGEAEAVTKRAVTLRRERAPLAERENTVFMGTSVAAGTGRAVVVASGMDTEIGRIAHLIGAAGRDEETPLQTKLEVFGRVLISISLGIVGCLFLLGLARKVDRFELFLTSVSLAVAAVPEGLPAIITIALALGVRRMSRRKALVRKLPAVETLGCTSVIGTDKTGTLTVGEMTVRSLYVAGERFEVTGEGYAPLGEILCNHRAPDRRWSGPLRELLTIMAGCNHAQLVEEDGRWKVLGDPTEGALLAAAGKFGIAAEQIENEQPAALEIPFDSVRKRKTVVRRLPDETYRALVNGAPELLLQRCTHLLTAAGVRPLTQTDRQQVLAQNRAMSRQALRVLGSAYCDLTREQMGSAPADVAERNLIFVGLAGMHDPPRPEAKGAVARCRAAGIRVVMITGDQPHTALALARELGIATDARSVLSGVELDGLSDEALRRVAPGIAVYARVTAEHKLRIIRAWKANDAVVAMTGDGVNDAPAIKGADIGIAMGKTGTEVTKQASDMIIVDDNFASIVAAVEEGRGIYDNIRKTLQYLLAGNSGELILVTACVLTGVPAPLLPIHLLWINLVTDGLPALCLAADPIDPDVMKRGPRPRTDKIADRNFLFTMMATGLLTAGVSVGVYLFGLQHYSGPTARTYAFTVLVFAELLRAFGSRSQTKPIWRLNHFSNLHLVVVAAISVGLQFLILQNEIIGRFFQAAAVPGLTCLGLLIVSAVPLVVLELLKAFAARRPGRGAAT